MPEDNNPTPDGAANMGNNAETKWTIMVYLAGDNNLADECVYALTGMKAVATDARIDVVAQFDPAGRRVKARRFEINKGGGRVLDRTRSDEGKLNRRGKIIEDALDEIEEGTVKFPGAGRRDAGQAVNPNAAAPRDDDADEGERDTGDPKTLFDFISWSVEHHPADHYMVVLAGHGGGIEEVFLRDDSSQGTLSIAELGQVFAAARSKLKDKDGAPLVIDILGMDSCLMSMAEICHELHGSVKYMVSTESFGPQSGWPYGRILESLTEALRMSGDATAEELASMIVDEHVEFYTEYAATDGLSVDISVIKVEQAESLAKAVEQLSKALTEELQTGEALKKLGGRSDFLDQIVLAHWEAQSYNGELFVDLFDFCDCLRRRYDPASVPAAPVGDELAAAEREQELRSRETVQKCCDEVISVIESLVRRSCYTGITFQYSYGVSIYFPWAEVAPDYTAARLKFVGASGWRGFLDTYVVATRRVPRGFQADKRVFALLERKVRKTPLDERGPSNIIVRSMRNPPIELVMGGLSDCTRAREETLAVIEGLALKLQ